MRVIATILLFYISITYAYSIEDKIKAYAYKYKVNPYILLAIAKHESKLNPFAIGFKTYYDFSPVIRKLKITCSRKVYRNSKGKLTAIYSCYPKTKRKALFLLKYVKKYAITYDIGLFQINEYHFKDKDAEKYFDTDRNITKAIYIFKSCKKRYPDIIQAVECYNKGRFKKGVYNYVLGVRESLKQLIKKVNKEY